MRFGPGIFLLLSTLVLAGCAKHEPVAEVVRPVQLAEVKLGSAANDSVFAGEVKPRHEADLAFRIGWQDHCPPGRSGNAGQEGAGACTHRCRGCGPADGSRQGLHGGGRSRGHLRAGRIRALPEPLPREIRERERAGAETQRRQRQSGAARPGAGATFRHPEPGRVRDAAGARRRRDHGGDGGAWPGRRGGADGVEARPRGPARGRDQRAGRSHRRDQGRAATGGFPVGQSAETLSRPGARDRAGGRRRDPHLCRSRIDPAARCGPAMGHDRQRGPSGRGVGVSRADSVGVALPQGWRTGGMGL